MCVFLILIFFFVGVYTMSSRNNASIFHFSTYLALRRSTYKISSIFLRRRDKRNKKLQKISIFSQNQFLTKSILVFCCNSKINERRSITFALVVVCYQRFYTVPFSKYLVLFYAVYGYFQFQILTTFIKFKI